MQRTNEHCCVLELRAFCTTASNVKVEPLLLENRLRAEERLRRAETTSFSVASMKHLLGGAGEGTTKLESSCNTCYQSDFNTNSLSSFVNLTQFVAAPLLVFVCRGSCQHPGTAAPALPNTGSLPGSSGFHRGGVP